MDVVLKHADIMAKKECDCIEKNMDTFNKDLSRIINPKHINEREDHNVSCENNGSSTGVFLSPNNNVSKKRPGASRPIGSDVSCGPPNPKRRFSQGGVKGKSPRAPTKFHNGGSIGDPLNLNSLNDEKTNKASNAETPTSSPLPTPSHREQPVKILIPPNIEDPLNLNSGDSIAPVLLSPKKRKKHNRKKSANDSIPKDKDDTGEKTKESQANNTIDSLSEALREKIASAIPQNLKNQNRVHTKCEKTTKNSCPDKKDVNPPSVKSKVVVALNQQSKQRYRPKDEKFVHGNYNRYYGKRNPNDEEDHRLQCFHKDWFENMNVLDIGCNIGHVTLSLAKHYHPKHIVGVDIDGKLISIAKKNICHYMADNAKKYPISCSITCGPIAAPVLPSTDNVKFPNNVSFIQGNYVLENDSLLETVREEYDCILALSISKWVHLNNGDEGMKRFFKRVFRHLRPGGKFILEPQPWSSYKKKKKLTEKIFQHYQNIRFRPDQFTEYLLSNEVGFSTCDHIDIPYNKSKGFQRPLHMFTKATSSYTTPATESRGVTPLLEVHCTPHFEHPSHSANATPRYQYSAYMPFAYDHSSTPDYRGNTPNHVGIDASVVDSVAGLVESETQNAHGSHANDGTQNANGSHSNDGDQSSSQNEMSTNPDKQNDQTEVGCSENVNVNSQSDNNEVDSFQSVEDNHENDQVLTMEEEINDVET